MKSLMFKKHAIKVFHWSKGTSPGTYWGKASCLKNHLRFHIDKKPHVCKVYRKAFLKRGDLNRPLQIRLGSHVGY